VPGVGCINPPALRQQGQTHVPAGRAARGHYGAVPGVHVDAPKAMQKMEGTLPKSLFLWAMAAMDCGLGLKMISIFFWDKQVGWIRMG